MNQTHTPTSTGQEAVEEPPRRFVLGRVFRAMLWILLLQVALQPVFAGMLLDGNPTGSMLHLINGSLAELTALILLVVAILVWRPGRAPGRVALMGILLFLVVYAQAAVGHMHALQVHVPLGVLTLLLVVWLLFETRNLRPGPRIRKGNRAPN